MGRFSTGIYEVGEAKKISLSFLIKHKYLIKGKVTKGTLSWTLRGEQNGEISIICSYTKKEKYIRLAYIDIHGTTKEETKYDYKIELVSIPSNLGKGEVLYMMCPSGYGLRCRILYNAYRSGKWYSRKYFERKGCRVYYPSQARSKDDYEYNRKHHFEKLWKSRFDMRNFHPYHKGKKTKALIRFEKIRDELEYWTKKTDTQFNAKVMNLMKYHSANSF